jgi:hypothetical protein
VKEPASAGPKYKKPKNINKISILCLSKYVSYDTILLESRQAMEAPQMTANKTTPAITRTEYSELDRAYDFFNARLFGGELPPVLITLQRHAGAKGYFSPQRFNGRRNKAHAHELALNPDVFTGRTDELILSTLAHEMAHVWQQEHGAPSRGGYHNRQWAEKMKEIGLHPSETGEHGGNETGQRVTHYIVPGGPFQIAALELMQTGFAINWQSPAASAASKAKAASKTKFTCPVCEQNAWGKPDSKLICGACYEDDGDIYELEAAS